MLQKRQCQNDHVLAPGDQRLGRWRLQQQYAPGRLAREIGTEALLPEDGSQTLLQEDGSQTLTTLGQDDDHTHT